MDKTIISFLIVAGLFVRCLCNVGNSSKDVIDRKIEKGFESTRNEYMEFLSHESKSDVKKSASESFIGTLKSVIQTRRKYVLKKLAREISPNLVDSLSSCELFSEFLVTVTEAENDLLPLMAVREHEGKCFLIRRSRLWLRKIHQKFRYLLKSCVPLLSDRRLFKQQLLRRRSKRKQYSRKTKEKSLDLSSTPGSSGGRTLQDRDITPEFNITNFFSEVGGSLLETAVKSTPFEKEVSRLVKKILAMLSRNGKTDVIVLLREITKLNKPRRISIKLEDNSGECVKVSIGDQLRRVPPYFLSVAVGARILQDGLIAKLSGSRRFLNLARGLSPAILRFGGTYADFVIYDPEIIQDDHKTVGEEKIFHSNQERLVTGCPFDSTWHKLYRKKPKKDSTYDLLKAMVSAVHAEPEADAGEAVDVKHYANFTMTPTDWAHLTYIAKLAGMKLLFQLNQFLRTTKSDWNPANARLILRDAASRGDSIFWQLGNEPNSYGKFGLEFTGSLDARDFNRLHQEIMNFYSQPSIVGPDVTRPHHPAEVFDDTELDKLEGSIPFLTDFLSHLENNLTAISWHQYYINGRTATLEDLLSVEVLDYLSWQIPQVVDVRDRLAPGTPIWLTETSSAYGGGAANLSNRYADGFSWLDKLGMAALMGIDVVARQTLYQGHYALIDPKLNPLPSYWLSWVHKNLIGGGVLNITLENASKTTRLYAHCQNSLAPSYKPGNVVIFGMNLAEITVHVRPKRMPRHYSIHQYLLEPENGDLQSEFVLLNGVILQMTSADKLPHLTPLTLSKKSFQMPPKTLGFWVLVNASVQDCMVDQ